MLTLFIWAPLYIYLKRNELWRKDRASTLAFAACVLFVFLVLWAVFRFDYVEARIGIVTFLTGLLLPKLFHWFEKLFRPANETASRP